jgi:hypothetical protein
MMPQAPIGSCEIPVHTAAPLQNVPHEKKGSTHRASERAAESACEKCVLRVWNFQWKLIIHIQRLLDLRKSNAEKDPGVFTQHFSVTDSMVN